MKKFKQIIAIAATLTAVTLLAACGKSSSSTSSSKTVKIGVLQLVSQSALDDARKGFEQELAKEGYKSGKNLKLDYVNAQGDQSNLKTMSQQLQKDKNDLNLAIATPAAQALQKQDNKTPMLFTAVTDPKSAGLVTNLKHPDTNATGVTDKVNTKAQIELLHKMFPKAKKIGLLYNAAEENSVVQIKTAKRVIKSLGLTPVEKTVATTNDVQQTAGALAKQLTPSTFRRTTSVLRP